MDFFSVKTPMDIKRFEIHFKRFFTFLRANFKFTPKDEKNSSKLISKRFLPIRVWTVKNSIVSKKSYR